MDSLLIMHDDRGIDDALCAALDRLGNGGRVKLRVSRIGKRVSVGVPLPVAVLQRGDTVTREFGAEAVLALTNELLERT